MTQVLDVLAQFILLSLQGLNLLYDVGVLDVGLDPSCQGLCHL